MESWVLTGLQRSLDVESTLLCYTAKRLLEPPKTLKYGLGVSGWMFQVFEVKASLNTKCFQGGFRVIGNTQMVLENAENALPIQGNR